jgi:hypothetical protein
MTSWKKRKEKSNEKSKTEKEKVKRKCLSTVELSGRCAFFLAHILVRKVRPMSPNKNRPYRVGEEGGARSA